MTDATPSSIPREPGRWRALTLAAAVHLALLAFLWIGVRWQNETPISVEAEIWSPQVREAAPRPQEPEARPEPKPDVKAPPKPEIAPPPTAKPDIALEQEKKRKEKEQKAREEEQHIQQQRAEKAKAEELAARKREEERLKKEAEAKKEAQAKKEAEAKKRKQELAEQVALEKRRADDMQRMLAQAGAGGSGDAPRSQGPRGDASYGSKVGAKIKSNTVFNVPENLPGNAPVEYAVELLPDGSIRHPIRKIRSSGVPGFDEAVLNAIEKSQPYPPDKSGKVPSGFNVVHKPKDQ